MAKPKEVIAFKDNGIYGEYESIRAASIGLNISNTTIKKMCDEGYTTVDGFAAKYKKEWLAETKTPTKSNEGKSL